MLNNIGRFVFQWFKNIPELDLCLVFIVIEILILRIVTLNIYGTKTTG